MSMISIVDYGMGNIGSLENMIRKVGGISQLVSDADGIRRAQKLILPGVGAFDNAIRKLRALGIVEELTRKVLEERVPILCICLGAQLITHSSEEGTECGLGWVEGMTVKFNFGEKTQLRIPHMGWNSVTVKKTSRLFEGMESDPCFYFVHAYHLSKIRTEDILTTSEYGYEFVSSIERENIYALQFHPEKSHKFGMRIVRNFVGL